ncbi:MAG: hypothetical protein V4580_15010 [Bacteroidota bacterium]
MSTSNSIHVTKGKRGDSGYDSYNVINKDGYSNGKSRWIIIGGAKLRGVPDKLYFSSHGDIIIVAYNTKDLTVRSFWNVTKDEGKLYSVINLIFHPYLWTMIIAGACLLLAFKKEIKTEENFRNYVFLAYGTGIVIALICSFFDWRKDVIASDKVKEVKNMS